MFKGAFLLAHAEVRNMNKEFLNEQIIKGNLRNPDVHLVAPGSLSVNETADRLISLLQNLYTRHGITKNREGLERDILNGKVLTWFAVKNSEFVATASLVMQNDGSWELGRAVSLDRGNGIGKQAMLGALNFHLNNHKGLALIGEVRAADEFKGIPSGLATQKIFFDLINGIIPMTPYALAPLFSHGNPLRNEQFILSASDVDQTKTITERIMNISENRSTKGDVPKLHCVTETPFRLVIPNDEGKNASDIITESEHFNGCSLFPIEVIDKNTPLIRLLKNNINMVFCGVDRVLGKEGKPVLLIATLGFRPDATGRKTELAPTKVSESLPVKCQEDIQKISERFELILLQK